MLCEALGMPGRHEESPYKLHSSICVSLLPHQEGILERSLFDQDFLRNTIDTNEHEDSH